MITYNHEKFLAQALNSVLTQEVNFDYEIVIGEDCSTDNTRNILISYQQKYPDKIRLLLADKNLGMHENFIQTYKACRGEYIALLEGDDYLTSPQKLQKQVDFLDHHSNCAIVYHMVELFDEKKGQMISILGEGYQKLTSTLDDYLRFTVPIQTSAVMFRRELFLEFPHWIKNVKMGDVVIFAMVGQYGHFGFIPEKMSVWRWHSGGVWTTKNSIEHLKGFIEIWELLSTYLESRYKKSALAGLGNFYSELAIQYFLSGDFNKARGFLLRKLLKFPAILPKISDVKLIFKISTPRVYEFLKRLRYYLVQDKSLQSD